MADVTSVEHTIIMKYKIDWIWSCLIFYFKFCTSIYMPIRLKQYVNYFTNPSLSILMV